AGAGDRRDRRRGVGCCPAGQPGATRRDLVAGTRVRRLGRGSGRVGAHRRSRPSDRCNDAEPARSRPGQVAPGNHASLRCAPHVRIFSGIQPTGRKHLGNYIGAITQWVAGQDRGDAIYCVVDLHAITVAYDPAKLRESVYDTAATLLAAGLDSKRCIFFRQSDVVEHPELCWLLSSVTSFGELGRMTQFKEKSGSQRELVSAGLFFYPVLQAADVLAYRANEVPVGED